jgi:hypothetical protein
VPFAECGTWRSLCQATRALPSALGTQALGKGPESSSDGRNACIHGPRPNAWHGG